MSARTLIIAATGVFALSLLLFLAPPIGMIIVALIVVGVPGLLFLDRAAIVRRRRSGPGASGPGERGYRGGIGVGEEDAADYGFRRRAS